MPEPEEISRGISRLEKEENALPMKEYQAL
jgi:hypothetical protein